MSQMRGCLLSGKAWRAIQRARKCTAHTRTLLCHRAANTVKVSFGQRLRAPPMTTKRAIVVLAIGGSLRA